MRLPKASDSEDLERLLSWAKKAGGELDSQGTFRARFRQAGKLGLTGLGVPKDYGGAGLSAYESVAVN